MIKVLVITNLLPIQEIKHKKAENDILLVTEDRLKTRYPEICFKFLYVVPYTNKGLSKLSPKWKSYYNLKKSVECSVRGRLVKILPVLQLPKPTIFRTILYDLSISMNMDEVSKTITDFDPTVIHAHNTDVDAYIARKIGPKFGIPYVVTLRGLKRIADSAVKKNIESAKELIAISPTQKKQAVHLTNKEIQLIPHGIPEIFYNKPYHKANKRKPVLRLIAVCRLLKLKNLDLVIEALADINEDYIFDIYGDGPEKSNLETLINDLGVPEKIYLKGSIPNSKLPETFKQYNLFVMPSFPETLGRVYFEAMASGLPVIGAEDTGIDGIVKHGNEGFLVNLNNHKDLTKVLEYAISNKEELTRMGENAHYLAKNYSWDRILPEIKKIYS